jgi:putative membrane protein
MRILALSAAAALAVGAAGCNRQGEAVNPGQTEPVNAAQDAIGAAVGAASGPTAALTTGSYVGAAAVADMYEVEAGRIAGQKATRAEVKSFGQMMVADHTATTTKLKPLAAAAGAEIPAGLDQRRQGFLDNLRAASAADFDRVYIDQQVAAHNEALALHKGYADGGDNAALKAFAAETAPKVQMHLEEAQRLQGK